MTNFTCTPMMADKEIEIIDSLFLNLRPKMCLEWGSGGSTIYWPKKHGFIQKWVSIETDRQWHEYVKVRMDPKVDLRLVDFQDYYTAVFHEGIKFDFILVDGLYRTCCLVAATQLVQHTGMVVLHDAGRPEYDNAVRIFQRSELLYEGELPRKDQPRDAHRKGYLHRGIRVFYP